LNVETGSKKILFKGGTAARYSPTGHIVYASTVGLQAMPFNLSRLEVSSGPLSLIGDIAIEETAGVAVYDVAKDGTLVYSVGKAQSAQRSLVWVNRQGKERPTTAPAGNYFAARLSSDGQRVAGALGGDREGDIWLYDFVRKSLTRFTLENGNSDLAPLWTPDGRRIAYGSAGTNGGLFWKAVDSSQVPEQLVPAATEVYPSSWSSDGKFLLFDQVSAGTKNDIWVLSMDDRKARPLLQTGAHESWGVFSPDNRWIAYSSDESGRPEIYVQPFPGPGGKWTVSSNGGITPVWSRNDQEIFYRFDRKVVAVKIQTQPTFSAGVPAVLFEGPYHPFDYDVTADGQQFLMLKMPAEAAVPQIKIVLNWFEELKRLAATPLK
jgi:dipeptidyl aminopeptidase/acylaminoacyl peptidase